MTPGWLLLLAALGGVLGIASGPRSARVWIASTLGGTLAGLIASGMVLAGASSWEWRSGITLGGELVHLRLDALSALFLALLCVVGGAGALYAREYWSPEHYPASAARGRVWWTALLFNLGLVLLCANGLHFLLAWELFTVCAYFLVTLDRQRPEVRAAGWLYLVASHLGTVCLFAFFGLLAARTGSWELGPLRDRPELAPLFWLAMVGFGIKAGVFPLHVWLPSAHANAPSHVSALMSGVAIKMGIYGLVRFSGWLPVPASAGWLMIGMGAASALIGIAFALAQSDLKRLLAYCSVENVGVLWIGLGGALLASAQGEHAWGRWALAGALFHVWNHGAFKALLFLGAGSVLHATGTREMSRLGGLWRSMPWTAGLFVLASLAAAGLPPLNGFVSEWLVYLGLAEAAIGKGPAAWATIPAMIALGMAGAMALASFAKAGTLIFLGSPRSPHATEAHECGPCMRAPMIALAGLCLLFGLAPILFWPALARAVEAWRPAWTPAVAPEAMLTLGACHLALGGLLLVAGAGLWRMAHANGLRQGPTWDCGFANPRPRMQYTSTSFAGIVAGWFRWVLQPERQLRRPRGPFPTTAVRLERIPETVLERVAGPVGDRIMSLSTAVRRLQHGRLQSYILYLVGGLVALGLLVSWGGSR